MLTSCVGISICVHYTSVNTSAVHCWYNPVVAIIVLKSISFNGFLYLENLHDAGLRVIVGMIILAYITCMWYINLFIFMIL